MNCTWIGIGAVIEKDALLYPNLKKINDYLTKEMSGGFGYSNALRPHINFYDLSVDSKNIEKIKNSLSEVLDKYRSIECKITGIKYFKFGIVYAEIEKNEELIKLHQEILGVINPYKGDCIDPDYEKLIPVLSEEQKESLKKFGNPYMSDFKPHISLGYLPDKKDSLGEVISKIEPMLLVREFTINKLDLVKNRTAKEIEILSQYFLF
jgi:2'-5' RNA ligase